MKKFKTSFLEYSKLISDKYHGLKVHKWFRALLYSTKILFEFFAISLIVVTITFFLINAVPGTTGLTSGLNEAQKNAVESQYGLNDPLMLRYFRYLGNIFKGDFGISYSLYPTKEISSFVWERFGVSAVIGLLSTLVTLLIGIPVGIWVGKNPGKFVDNAATFFISILVSIPSMVFALLLLLMGRSIGIPYIFDISNWLSYLLPTFALSLGGTIAYIRYIRTELNSELSSNHAKFAYLKGVSKSRFIWRHGLKPSLFPIATFFPAVILGSFIGSMFVEKIFAIPGSGGLFLSAIQSNDYNIILFLVIMFSITSIISFELRDVLYRVLDPRIRR